MLYNNSKSSSGGVVGGGAFFYLSLCYMIQKLWNPLSYIVYNTDDANADALHCEHL